MNFREKSIESYNWCFYMYSRSQTCLISYVTKKFEINVRLNSILEDCAWFEIQPMITDPILIKLSLVDLDTVTSVVNYQFYMTLKHFWKPFATESNSLKNPTFGNIESFQLVFMRLSVVIWSLSLYPSTNGTTRHDILGMLINPFSFWYVSPSYVPHGYSMHSSIGSDDKLLFSMTFEWS